MFRRRLLILYLAQINITPVINHHQPDHLAWSIGIAVALSFILAATEITKESKKPLRSSLVIQSLFYLCLLTFGNLVTTLMSTVIVSQMNPELAPYFFIFTPFIGVFAFAAILKNTNITFLGKGVLTIQAWIKELLTTAAEATIINDLQLIEIKNGKLANKLAALPEKDLNTFVILKLSNQSPTIVQDLDQKAHINNADPMLYKAYAIVTSVPHIVIASFLNGR